jgi:hypothetical protein
MVSHSLPRPDVVRVLTGADRPEGRVRVPVNLLEAGHALDVEMEKNARKGMLIADHRRSGMQIAPAVETSAAQNAADGGRTESGALRNLINRPGSSRL